MNKERLVGAAIGAGAVCASTLIVEAIRWREPAHRYMIIEPQRVTVQEQMAQPVAPTHPPDPKSPVGLMIRCKANAVAESAGDRNGIAVDLANSRLDVLNCLRENAGELTLRFSDTPQPVVVVLE